MQLEEKFYVSLCALFVVLIVVSNLVYQKFVYLPIFSIYTFELSVGAIFYPVTFLITNLISEFYGKEKAQFCVRLATSINILVLCIISFMGYLQATDWSKIDNNTFDSVFGAYSISLFGSMIASYTAQMIDIRLYLLIRKLTNNKYLFLRNLSSAISLFVDTSIVIIFVTIIGVVPYEQMISLIFNSYLFKLFFTIVTTPIFYYVVYYIRTLSDPKNML
ncbi:MULTISPECIES: queuosine precursor transporter [unclassified Candidatus Tisiphia]|jgi:queuosine precursor transporter|uniref:queuosine precursor transporter n=1 Tax=unclassified Candidatus Tisiphia TaxID=2996318 RepID=UPI001D6BEAAF|nr:queuosine precursor transporter [Rickettsia endosymbiont of Sericostoma sp. HW-2014]